MSVFSGKKNITFRSNKKVSDLSFYLYREVINSQKFPARDALGHNFSNERLSSRNYIQCLEYSSLRILRNKLGRA